MHALPKEVAPLIRNRIVKFYILFQVTVGEEIYQNDVSLLYLTPLQAFSLHIPSRHHPNSPSLFPSSPFGLRF